MRSEIYVFNGEEFAEESSLLNAIFFSTGRACGFPMSDEEIEELGVTVEYPTTLISAEESDFSAQEEELNWRIAHSRVTVDGMAFDADEDSQNRMSRAITLATAQGKDFGSTSRPWLLADKTLATVTISQLLEALRLASEAQDEILQNAFAGADEEQEAVA